VVFVCPPRPLTDGAWPGRPESSACRCAPTPNPVSSRIAAACGRKTKSTARQWHFLRFSAVVRAPGSARYSVRCAIAAAAVNAAAAAVCTVAVDAEAASTVSIQRETFIQGWCAGKSRRCAPCAPRCAAFAASLCRRPLPAPAAARLQVRRACIPQLLSPKYSSRRAPPRRRAPQRQRSQKGAAGRRQPSTAETAVNGPPYLLTQQKKKPTSNKVGIFIFPLFRGGGIQISFAVHWFELSPIQMPSDTRAYMKSDDSRAAF
jgi:hypothetical protein